MNSFIRLLLIKIIPYGHFLYFFLQEYKKQFENTLQQIEEEKQCLLVAEQRWMDSWNTSVEKVKLLYEK